MSRAASPFRPLTLLAVLLVGALAFLLFLYALGQGWTGDGEARDGGEHAAAVGLNGHGGLARLLRARGAEVELSRNAAALEEPGLVILTPPLFTPAEELAQIIATRQQSGPTVLILPKWGATVIPANAPVEAEPGWVLLGNPTTPVWFDELRLAPGARLAIGQTHGWQSTSALPRLAGTLPRPEAVQALIGQPERGMEALVMDAEGDVLAARLAPANGRDWPLVVVFEPDLTNNFGMADETRARLALALVQAAWDGAPVPAGPLRFDLTLAGLGRSENLLTLAFRPPFLAATLCLLAAALVIGWRGFARFGPALAAGEALPPGKTQLVHNGAALIARTGRWHLVRAPYAEMITARLAARLALASTAPEAREAAIDQALARRGATIGTYINAASTLRRARRPGEILAAARALRNLERMIAP